MAVEEALRTSQSADEMVKTDITLLTIQCKDLEGSLFTKLSRHNGDPVATYNDFISIFYKLYHSFKYNARMIPTIKNWLEKEKIFDDFFDNTILKGAYEPEKAIKFFRMLFEDMAPLVYNITATEFVER